MPTQDSLVLVFIENKVQFQAPYLITFATIKGRIVNKYQNNPSYNFSWWKYNTGLFDLDFVYSVFVVYLCPVVTQEA